MSTKVKLIKFTYVNMLNINFSYFCKQKQVLKIICSSRDG